MLDRIKSVSEKIEKYFLGYKSDTGLAISEKHRQVLEDHGLTPTRELRNAGFHDVISRVLIGADVIQCTNNQGVESVAHLTEGLVSGRTLASEARIAQAVAGIDFCSDNGWLVKFPESVNLFKDGKSTLTVYPFYQGDNGEIFTKQYSDEDLTKVGMAVLTGMESMYQQLDPVRKKILEANGRKVGPVLSGGRQVIGQWLKMKGLLTAKEVDGLLTAQQMASQLAKSSSPRLIHHDLHTFNVIPNPDTKNIVVVDLAMLSVGQSFADFGRWLTFLLIADRKNAMLQLENRLLDKGIITRDGLQCAKAGALIDWGRELTERPKAEDVVTSQRVEAGKRLWREEVNHILNPPAR
jgi:hypothetical protein